MIIHVKKQFNDHLVHRNKLQGDGKFTAKEFREKFLKCLDSEENWKKILKLF